MEKAMICAAQGSAPKADSQIETELRELGLQLAGLDAAVRTLRNQLEPVCVDEPVKNSMGCAAQAVTVPCCPIADRIKSHYYAVSEIVSVIDDIQRRIRC